MSFEAISNLDLSKNPQTDFVLCAKFVGNNVNKFLRDHNLTSATDEDFNDADKSVVALEGLSASDIESKISAQSIEELVDACGIPEYNKKECIKQLNCVASRLLKNAHGSNGASVWREQGMSAPRSNNRLTGNLSSILPTSYLDVGASMESFGIDTDKVVPELKLSFTVTIMRFHNNISAKLFAVRSTQQPYVEYTKENYLQKQKNFLV